MSTNWTEEQEKAIFTKNCNLLIAAGAGAGKTAVLVERIIQRVMDEKDNVDIDNLLVVTFTNAAAAEMRERIGESISKKLETNPESKKLQRQLTLLNKSNIMTIHSFCLDVIRNNFHLMDLDPEFRVCDETEAVLLKGDTIEELFDERYEDEDKEFLRLIDAYGTKNDIKVQDIVLDLYNFAKSTPWPHKWLDDMGERFNVEEKFNFSNSILANIILDYIKMEVKGAKAKTENALNIVKNAEGIDYYLSPIERDLENISLILNCKNWDELKEKFDNLTFDTMPTKRNKDADKEAKEASKKLRDEVKKKLLSMKEDIFSNSNNIEKTFKELYPMMRCLCTLVKDFDLNYGVKKRERGLIDFNDIEHFCLNILVDKDENENIIPSNVAEQYKMKFDEILIDEYQDSNEVQELIMKTISGKNYIPNMFMVGDVKQSIYRFRQAKPEIFLQKYNTYSEEDGKENRKIKLFKNFRSRKEIIDGVNFLFSIIMSKNIGELEYNEEEALESAAKFPEIDQLDDNNDNLNDVKKLCGGDIEVHIIEKKDGVIDKELHENLDIEQEETPDNIQIESRLVAKKIKELIEGNHENRFMVYDKGSNAYRPVKYKDIVILLRATSNWAGTFMEELTKERIPVFADTASGYFETIEIKTIISLLQIIDNPMQDIPLIAVLRSPIEALSPEEFIDIRLVNKDVSFYEALKAAAGEYIQDVEQYKIEHISIELKNKIKDFLDKLKAWREKAIYTPLDQLIWNLYTETGYYGFVGAMPGGKQRQANLRVLFQRAKQYEKTSYKGLFNFINFINKLRSSSGDMGSAKILGENEDVVRIMSIHKSKGLEFPIVILSGMGKNFNLMDTTKSILFHGDLGLGPDYVDTKRRISYPTIAKEVLKRKIKIETLSEEMRILYVAFTRAKEKLIITSMVKDIEKNAKKWCSYGENGEKLPEYSILNAKNYMDWIASSIIKHKNGEVLRKLGNGENINIIDQDSLWKVRLWEKEQFKNNVQEEEESEDIVSEIEKLMDEEEVYTEEIERRLSFQYKYKESSHIPAKFSVSELKRRFATLESDEDAVSMVKPNSLKKPVFLQEAKTLSASERGTLMHLIMQHLDLNKVSSYEEIKEQVDRLKNREFITEESSKAVQIKKILEFFKSDLGKRMIKSKEKVHREVPFHIKIKSTEIYKDLSEAIYGDEHVLVQGIIDCYFEEDDELVLLDYKTDYVDDIEDIKDRYKIQIYYYAKALERLTGKKVKNKYIYLFFNGVILEI